MVLHNNSIIIDFNTFNTNIKHLSTIYNPILLTDPLVSFTAFSPPLSTAPCPDITFSCHISFPSLNLKHFYSLYDILKECCPTLLPFIH